MKLFVTPLSKTDVNEMRLGQIRRCVEWEMPFTDLRKISDLWIGNIDKFEENRVYLAMEYPELFGDGK